MVKIVNKSYKQIKNRYLFRDFGICIKHIFFTFLFLFSVSYKTPVFCALLQPFQQSNVKGTYFRQCIL